MKINRKISDDALDQVSGGFGPVFTIQGGGKADPAGNTSAVMNSSNIDGGQTILGNAGSNNGGVASTGGSQRYSGGSLNGPVLC